MPRQIAKPEKSPAIPLRDQMAYIFNSFEPTITLDEKNKSLTIQLNLRDEDLPHFNNADSPFPHCTLDGHTLTFTFNDYRAIKPTLTRCARQLKIPQGQALYRAAKLEIQALSKETSASHLPESLPAVLPLMKSIMKAVNCYQHGQSLILDQGNTSSTLRGDNLLQHIKSKLIELDHLTCTLKKSHRMHRLTTIMGSFGFAMLLLGGVLLSNILLAIPGGAIALTGVALMTCSAALYKTPPRTRPLIEQVERFQQTYRLSK